MQLLKIMLVGLCLSLSCSLSHAYNDPRAGTGPAGAAPGGGGSPSGVGKVVDKVVHGDKNKGTADEVKKLHQEKKDMREK